VAEHKAGEVVKKTALGQLVILLFLKSPPGKSSCSTSGPILMN